MGDDFTKIGLDEARELWEGSGQVQAGPEAELAAEMVAGAAHYLRELKAAGLGAPGSRDPEYVRAMGTRRDSHLNRALKDLSHAWLELVRAERVQRNADTEMPRAVLLPVPGQDEDPEEIPILDPRPGEDRSEVREAGSEG